MRHFLFAILIALLPLRGWMGDAMATQMAAGQIQHHQQTHAAAQANHVHEAMDAAHADHPTETQALHDCMDQAANDASHSNDDGHCETCAACQACHTVALSPVAPGLMPHFSAPALPRSAADPFASADAALRQKPPIS
ncbi:hypothetical protein ACEN8I_02940 [Polaromonas sp. CT11-55]|uniref:hypothetical protein n=1 Tax=Polaromonas sp. CT11-55 TaxID=3243045 RepID=UPI0039A4E821